MAEKTRQLKSPPLIEPELQSLIPQLRRTDKEKQASVRLSSLREDWTGFSDKTLWDWLNLMAVLLVPLMIGIFTIRQTQISNEQSEYSVRLSDSQHKNDQTIAQENRDKDVHIALDQQQAAILKSYVDDITELIIVRGLQESKPGDEVRVVARAKTLIALQGLDGERKGQLVHFLSDAWLIGDGQNGVIVSLREADLSNAYLENINLHMADLMDADLMDADLTGADLTGADLLEAKMSKANLSRAILHNSEMVRADLEDAIFVGANMYKTNLKDANLQNANFKGAIEGMENEKKDKTIAQLLAPAASLKGTILKDGSVYPSQSYPILRPPESVSGSSADRERKLACALATPSRSC